MQQHLVAVIAHPDDEFMAAGLLIRAKSLGYSTHLICGTQGEAGRIKGQHFRGNRDEELSTIRQKEFGVSCLLLNIDSYHNLGLPDHGAESWNIEESAAELEAILLSIGSSVIVTFNSDGGNRHPDHVGMHQMTVQAFGGLPKNDYILYFSTLFPKSFSEAHTLLKLPPPIMDQITINDSEVSAIVALSKEEHLMKLTVLDIYRSQFPDERGFYYKMPLKMLETVSRYECYENFAGGAGADPSHTSRSDMLFDMFL
ncbi:PIG-L family deacetylase [Paenibacillus sp. 2TAB19]|uniref:PIG-L family deacetylase n=1 Tax=Paenibacillus sp. 2TAB19 TaxID=3233003 RepID=UPI003F9D0797